MARHSLFPNSITIHYTANGHSHNMTLPVAAISGSAPGWLLTQRDDSTVDWRDAVDEFAVLCEALYPTGASFDYAELFTYEATDSPAEFLAAHTIDLAADGGGSSAPYVQVVFPFKATGGNSLRLTLLESTAAANQHTPYASLATGYSQIAEFLLSSDDWIITRGGTYPTVSLGITSKVNDKLRKRYLLDI